MTVIDTNSEYVTMINVFAVNEEDDQQRLVDMLAEFLEEHASRASGFVSATLHRSLDGIHVAVYAQWDSVEATERFGDENPEVAAFFEDVAAIAEFEYHPYEVVDTVTADDSP